MNDYDIKKWVNQCLQGNKDAFGPIVRWFQTRICNLCKHYLGTTQDAEDASADVFIKAYRSLSTFNPHYAFSTWLYRIAVNHCLSTLRRRKLETKFLEHATEDIHTSADAETLFFEKQKEKLYHQNLTNLPENYRTALMLKYQQDLPYNQISQIMDVPVNTVGSLILRGKKELRKKMKEALK